MGAGWKVVFFSACLAACNTPSPSAPDANTIPFVDGGPAQGSWALGFGGADHDWALASAVDEAGNIYLIGRFLDRITIGEEELQSVGDLDILVASFTPAGALRWAKGYGSSEPDWPWAIAISPAGELVITGVFSGAIDFEGEALETADVGDIFVLWMSTEGESVRARTFGSLGDDQGEGLAIDAAGEITLCGSFSNTLDLGGAELAAQGVQDIFVARLDAEGEHLWSVGIGGDGLHRTRRVALDGSGAAVVAGFFDDNIEFAGKSAKSVGDDDLLLLRFDKDGALEWINAFGSTGNDRATSLVVDAEGRTTVAGHFEETMAIGSESFVSAGDKDAFVAQFAADGSLAWARAFGGLEEDRTMDIALTSSGALLVTGSFSQSIDFADSTLTSAGDADLFFVSFNYAGLPLAGERVGSSGYDRGLDITIDDRGRTIVVGQFSGEVRLEGATLSSAGLEDGLIWVR